MTQIAITTNGNYFRATNNSKLKEVYKEIDKLEKTKFNVNMSALDYSTVAINTSTGATYLSKGNYAKTMSVDIFTPTTQANAVYKALVSARGTPVVFIGGVYELVTVYGYIQKFEEVLAGAVETAITVDVIGLI